MASQRIETRDLGTSGGLQSNITQQQNNQNNGLLVSDNVVYRPVSGISKRRGSKKLVESVDGETKRLVIPTQANDGVISIQEEDGNNSSKVLGYNKSGFQVDIYCLLDSKKVLLDTDISNLANYDKIRFEFDKDLYENDIEFIENAFDGKLAVFTGFFDATLTFNTIAVEQDSVDPDLLRVSKFVNLPTKNAEIVINASNSLSTAPTLSGTYDIVSVSADYFTIYPTAGSPAPAWTSTGDTGTISFTFQTFRVIEVDEKALTTSSFINYPNNKIFFERLGSVPINFGTDQIVTCLEDRSGDEIVFNSNLGQMYLSDEDPNNPKVSYYGTHKPVDCFAFYFTNRTNPPKGGIRSNQKYAYAATLVKTLNNQEFVSTPSPIFEFQTNDDISNYEPFSGLRIGLTIDGEIFLEGSFSLIDINTTHIQIRTATSTPAIVDYTQVPVRVEDDGSYNIAYISVANQLQYFGAQITSISVAWVLQNKTNIIDVLLPEIIIDDLERTNTEYRVDLYRTVSVEPTENVDISQFFLVTQKTFSSLPNPFTPHIILEDGVGDEKLEFNLPLYTNITEEGSLKVNNLAPQHQNFVEKNGVMYLGDLKKQEVKIDTLESNENLIRYYSTGSDFIGDTAYLYTLATSFLDPILAPFNFSSANREFYDVINLNDLDNPQRVHIGNNLAIRVGTNFVYVWPSEFIVLPISKRFRTFSDRTQDVIYFFSFRPINLFFYNNIEETSYSLTLIGKKFYIDFNRDATNLIVVSKLFEEVLGISEDLDPFFTDSGESPFDLKIEEFRYQIAYSKPFEPAAFPPLQFLAVGSTKNIVYGIFKVRDSLIITSKEGFYRLTGDNELDYTITLIENDTVPLSALLMTKQSDRVFALTQKGFAACSETDLQVIDLPVQDITERFLQLYRTELDTFTVRQIYTAAPSFLNQIVFYMPSLNEKAINNPISTFGLSYDTASNQFSTVDLYTQDDEKFGVVLQSVDGSRYFNDYFNVPSFEPSSLQNVRSQVNRSDFAQHEEFIELKESWNASASILATSNILTITTTLEHRLEIGDYVTLIDGDNSVFVADASYGLSSTYFNHAVYAVQSVLSLTTFSVLLPSNSNIDLLDQVINFRFGRAGLPATLTLSSGSEAATLTINPNADLGWFPGQQIWVLAPFSESLKISLNKQTNLIEGARTITSVASNTINFELSSEAISNFSGSVFFSEDLRTPFKQVFGFNYNTLHENSVGIIYRNERLLYPFVNEQKNNNLYQGFLEKPLDKQYKPDRPSQFFTGVPVTIMTSRITGGDPCALKNFEQIIVVLQSIFSCTECEISFEGDRYGAAQGVVFKAQENLTLPFDPAFGDVLWSSIYQQWNALTNPQKGWKEAAPFIPIKVTTPNNVSQSTYLNLILRHSRPFESFAISSIAANGTFIDPTSAGV